MTSESNPSTPTVGAPGGRRLGTALGIVALGLLSVVVLVATRPKPARAVLDRVAPRVSVLSLEARSGWIWVEGSGTIRPRAQISLSTQVGGRVVEVSPSLNSGGSFRRGEVLLVIERASYENAVAIAEADVAQRRVDIALAEQEQVVAREEYRLLRARTGTTVLSDTARSTRLALREPQVEAARAALARATAQLADAQLNLDRTVVRAPFNGAVLNESVGVGQNVSPGQSLAELFDTDEAEMVVSLSQAEASLVDGLWDQQSGTGGITIPAKVRHDFGGVRHEWDGYVDRVEGALDPTTRTINAIVRIPSPFASDGRPPLLIGAYARALIAARELDRYFALPRSALREGEIVWVVTVDGTLSSSRVSVIQQVQDTVYISSDLADGSRVVTSDLSVMTPGMSVTATEEDGR